MSPCFGQLGSPTDFMIDSGEFNFRSGLSGRGQVFDRTTASISRGGLLKAQALGPKRTTKVRIKVMTRVTGKDFKGYDVFVDPFPMLNETGLWLEGLTA